MFGEHLIEPPLPQHPPVDVQVSGSTQSQPGFAFGIFAEHGSDFAAGLLGGKHRGYPEYVLKIEQPRQCSTPLEVFHKYLSNAMSD